MSHLHLVPSPAPVSQPGLDPRIKSIVEMVPLLTVREARMIFNEMSGHVEQVEEPAAVDQVERCRA